MSSERPWRARQRLFLLAVVGAVVVASTFAVVYVLTRSPVRVTPISLDLSNGSTMGAIEGNLTTVLSNAALVFDFTATTFANETNGLTSNLTLRLHTWTFFDSGCGCVDVNVVATVIGSFSADLKPGGLSLAANQTGSNAVLQSWEMDQAGTNVSFDPGQSFWLTNGTEALTATVIGEAGKPYNFSYSDYFNMRSSPRYNRFLGFQAAVTGPFTPVVDVGILLKIINTPGGIWA